MERNMIIKAIDYNLTDVGGKLRNTDSEFENLLRETLLSKMVVKNLRKGNIISVKDAKDKIQKMPFWKVAITSYVDNVIDKEKFKGISELKKKLKKLKEDFNENDDILEEQKLCHDELISIIKLLEKKNGELRKEWKEILIGINMI